MEYIILAIIKILDNIITTAKSITLYQNKAILSSILTIISQFLFFFVVSSIVTDGSILSIFIVSISAGIGSYIASFINNKLSKDRTWINIITCSNIEFMEELSKYLYKNKIKCIMYDAYTRKGYKTYTIQAFAKTRNESSLIDNYISKSNVKCLREIVE